MINKKWLGILLIIFGFGFLLQQLNVFDFSIILSTWWPLIFILIGLAQLISNPRTTAFSGTIFILLGVIFLGNQFIDVNLFTFLWPIFLILAGLIFILPRKKRNKVKDEENTIKNFTLFGGSNLQSNSKEFNGGEVTAIFGGAEINLRNISMINEAHLEIFAIFGGVTIMVPENIRVEIAGTPIFGGWENKVKQTLSHSDAPTLFIDCYPIFGGVEIKN